MQVGAVADSNRKTPFEFAHMPKLILMSGPGQTRQVALNPQETRVGRAATNDIVVDVARVSRVHALFMIGEAFVSITDLGSKNGTFVNGSRINGQVFLANGDTVRIGDCDMRFLAVDQEYTQIEALRLLTAPGLLIDIDRKAPLPGDQF